MMRTARGQTASNEREWLAGLKFEALGGRLQEGPPTPRLRRAPSFARTSFGVRVKDGGGGGNWTRVPSQPTSRDYMLSPGNFFCYAMAPGLESHCLVRMKRSRLTTRGLRRQPCLLLRPSTVAGVQWRTSWP